MTASTSRERTVPDQASRHAATATTSPRLARHLERAVTISRPLLWLNTSIPFLWALARGKRRFTGLDIVFLAFFTFPYNYFLHAVNDLFDFETDRINPRKGGVEGALTPREELRGHAIASCPRAPVPAPGGGSPAVARDGVPRRFAPRNDYFSRSLTIKERI